MFKCSLLVVRETGGRGHVNKPPTFYAIARRRRRRKENERKVAKQQLKQRKAQLVKQTKRKAVQCWGLGANK